MTTVAPGDTIGPLPDSGAVRASSSVVRHGNELRTTQCGTLYAYENKFDVRVTSRQYQPVPGDGVIGLVTGAAPCPLSNPGICHMSL